ncbi:MAG: ATP-binding cassette domain-containing protein [Bacteroidota bacterium]
MVSCEATAAVTTTNSSSAVINSISLQDATKRFNGRAVFENLNLEILNGQAWAVTGANGSGKSTLIKVISGFFGLSSGNISWQSENGAIDATNIHKHCAIAAPYLELFEEFTLEENIRIYGDLKNFKPGMSNGDVLEFIGLAHASKKRLKEFSSGMKQRTKLGLAFCANTGILLLDEPLSNLDSKGYEWYRNVPQDLLDNRIVIVGSNLEGDETRFCGHSIRMAVAQ